MHDEIANACNAFADANFTNELCSGSEQKFWSCVSEALLATHLSKVGLIPLPSDAGGPDFLITENGRNIWIEVICPEPIGFLPAHDEYVAASIWTEELEVKRLDGRLKKRI